MIGQEKCNVGMPQACDSAESVILGMRVRLRHAEALRFHNMNRQYDVMRASSTGARRPEGDFGP